MDLNKLTKKELVEYAESLNRYLNIKDKKEELIASIEKELRGKELLEYIQGSKRRENSGETDAEQIRNLKSKINILEERMEAEENSRWHSLSIESEKERVKDDNKAFLVVIGFFVFVAIWMSFIPIER